MKNFMVDKRKILKRTSHGLQWENKPPKLKRSIHFWLVKGDCSSFEIDQNKEMFLFKLILNNECLLPFKRENQHMAKQC